MAIDLYAIHEAVRDQIIANVARDVNVYAARPDNPQFPYIAVVPGDPYVSYSETYDGEADVNINLVIVQNAATIDAQIAVFDMLSAGVGKTSSVVDAIEADETLGGVVESCSILTCEGFTFLEGGGVAATLPLQIFAARR